MCFRFPAFWFGCMVEISDFGKHWNKQIVIFLMDVFILQCISPYSVSCTKRQLPFYGVQSILFWCLSMKCEEMCPEVTIYFIFVDARRIWIKVGNTFSWVLSSLILIWTCATLGISARLHESDLTAVNGRLELV